MAFEWDPITFTNLILCMVIFALGYLGYLKTRNLLPIYVGVAFGLFGVSHFLTLAGFKSTLTVPLIIIRTVAYLLVIFALYKYWQENIQSREVKQAWIDFYKEETSE